MSFDVVELRKKIPALQQKVSGSDLIYLDNAASSLMHSDVIERLNEYHTKESSNVHRGAHFLSQRATDSYENARKQVQNFIGLGSDHPPCIVFTRGTTEGVNLVAYSWGLSQLKPGDEILLTECEHHSNFVPWQQVAQKTGAQLVVVPVPEKKSYELEDFSRLITPKTRLVSTFWYSNALGWKNPVEELSGFCQEKNILFFLDAAQTPLHQKMDLSQLSVDFMAFSSHKMLGPHGVGALYVSPDVQSHLKPFQWGGSMIDRVSLGETTFADFPQSLEAGTPNIGGAIGFGLACDIVAQWSMAEVKAHIEQLRERLVTGIQELEGFRVLDYETTDQGAVVSLVHENAHPSDVAELLNQYGVSVRAGHHCTQPLMEKLGLPGTVRFSLAPYNTSEEVDKTLGFLKKVSQFL